MLLRMLNGMPGFRPASIAALTRSIIFMESSPVCFREIESGRFQKPIDLFDNPVRADMPRLINDPGRFDIGGTSINGRVETLSKIHFNGAGELATYISFTQSS